MGLITAYLVTTKNLDAFLNSLLSAQAPERFNNKFLESLDFTSSNDRLFIGLLKGLNFIDDTGVPKQRYFEFLDQTQSKRVLAQAITEAYEDLFRVNIKAHELTEEEVKNKLKTLTQGQKSDNVVRLMASTFKALCEWADWSQSAPKPKEERKDEKKKEEGGSGDITEATDTTKQHKRGSAATLHYNIQIHLPESRDPAVFDAIFKSLKQHLIE